MAKTVEDVIQLENLQAEISSREHTDAEGNVKTYFDVDFSRTYRKGDDLITTRTFQYRDLDRLTSLVVMARTKVGEMVRDSKEE
jgi:hypothetical protein